jgi:glucokinase
MLICVLDIGGGHLSHAMYDLASGRLMSRASADPASADRAIAHIPLKGCESVNPLHAIRDIAESASALFGCELGGMSLAVPNPFDPVAGISLMRHKLTELYGAPLRQLLAEATNLPKDAFTFVNDADAFLLGALAEEADIGKRSIGITLGTGIGSAFAVDGEIVWTVPGVPDGGEIWNLPFGSGTVEDAISTATLVADYLEQSGRRMDVAAIAAAARGGDPIAQEVFVRFGTQLAEVLNKLCRDFPAEQILLGGGICGAEDLFLPVTRKRLAGPRRLEIVRNRAAAPLVGAGIAWRRSRPAPVRAGQRLGSPLDQKQEWLAERVSERI